VKPFEQRQRHGTVTIRLKLKISNQIVAQKQARTDCERQCECGARVCCRVWCASLLPHRRMIPGLSGIPGGSVAADDPVQLAIFSCQPALPLSQARRRRQLHGHRHHPPGIRNFHSDSYAEIGTDSLRTRLRALCASLPEFARDPPRPGQRTHRVSNRRLAWPRDRPTAAQQSRSQSSHLVGKTQHLMTARISGSISWCRIAPS
jgi:hypothetical protein